MSGVMQTRAKPSILLHFPILRTLRHGHGQRQRDWLLISTSLSVILSL